MAAVVAFMIAGPAGPASAAAPSPVPAQNISGSDKFFSIFCPILFLVVAVGGGVLVARKRSAREERRRAQYGSALPLPGMDERPAPGKRPRGLPVGPLREYQQEQLAQLQQPHVELPEPADPRELPKPSMNGHNPSGQVPPEDPKRRFKRGY